MAWALKCSQRALKAGALERNCRPDEENMVSPARNGIRALVKKRALGGWGGLCPPLFAPSCPFFPAGAKPPLLRAGENVLFFHHFQMAFWTNFPGAVVEAAG